MSVQVGYIQKQIITISIRLPPKKMELQVPNTWTINKLKCLIQNQLPMMEFDKFQLSHEGMVLKGSYPLKIYTAKGQNRLQLMIIKMQGVGSFQEYYQRRMSKFFRRIHQQQEDQFEMDSDEPFYTLPINNDFYQEAYFKSKGLKYNRNQNNPDNANANVAAEGNPLFNMIFRVLIGIGILHIVLIIWTVGSYQRIAVIITAFLAYRIMDWHVKNQQNRRRLRNNPPPNVQNQNVERNLHQNRINDFQNGRKDNQLKKKQQKQPNISKQANQPQIMVQFDQKKQGKQQVMQKKKMRPNFAKCLLYACFGAQFFYCFFLSLFPNWTIQAHFQANREIIEKMVNKIEDMDQNLAGKIKFE